MTARFPKNFTNPKYINKKYTLTEGYKTAQIVLKTPSNVLKRTHVFTGILINASQKEETDKHCVVYRAELIRKLKDP